MSLWRHGEGGMAATHLRAQLALWVGVLAPTDTTPSTAGGGGGGGGGSGGSGRVASCGAAWGGEVAGEEEDERRSRVAHGALCACCA